MSARDRIVVSEEVVAEPCDGVVLPPREPQVVSEHAETGGILVRRRRTERIRVPSSTVVVTGVGNQPRGRQVIRVHVVKDDAA